MRRQIVRVPANVQKHLYMSQNSIKSIMETYFSKIEMKQKTSFNVSESHQAEVSNFILSKNATKTKTSLNVSDYHLSKYGTLLL